MAGKKVQLPVVGGIRKVVRVTDPAAAAANPGTTISEFANQTISLAQLKQALGLNTKTGGSTGGGGAAASLVPGPGLSGGGVLVGAVPINMIAPIPAFIFEEGGGGGGDGDPGPPGQNGATGAVGPMGPAVFFLPDDPEPALDAVPGAVGPPGSTGAGGPAGPATYLSAEDGEDGWHAIPGPQGIQGPPGAAAPVIWLPGEDGAEGDMGPPGPAGPQGSGGGGTVALPGTIPDLTFWWESDDILGASGALIARLRERTPWVTGVAAAATSNFLSIDSTQLNSLNVLKAPSGTNYALPNPFPLAKAGTGGCTFFAVFKPGSSGATQALIGGASGSCAFYLMVSPTLAVALVKSGIAVIGTSTTTWSVGTWYQANATYNASTGAYAFRQGRASAGSGTGTTGAGSGNTNALGSDFGGGNPLNAASIAALIVYDRVLSGTEITNVENYLNAKWGV